ncbi:hypothetical protein K438DRAFT_1770711 [Mycena galopus ATCC 62051]|nr:hypothetical protein K438DRAFT_1770711 [Mycena galopus ATCC 62051]
MAKKKLELEPTSYTEAVVGHGLKLLDHLLSRRLDAAGDNIFSGVRVDVGGEGRATIRAGCRVNDLVMFEVRKEVERRALHQLELQKGSKETGIEKKNAPIPMVGLCGSSRKYIGNGTEGTVMSPKCLMLQYHTVKSAGEGIQKLKRPALGVDVIPIFGLWRWGENKANQMELETCQNHNKKFSTGRLELKSEIEFEVGNKETYPELVGGEDADAADEALQTKPSAIRETIGGRQGVWIVFFDELEAKAKKRALADGDRAGSDVDAISWVACELRC